MAGVEVVLASTLTHIAYWMNCGLPGLIAVARFSKGISPKHCTQPVFGPRAFGEISDVQHPDHFNFIPQTVYRRRRRNRVCGDTRLHSNR